MFLCPLVGIVTHGLLFIGWISTWFRGLIVLLPPLSGGRRSAEISRLVRARKGGMERGSSVSVTGSPGWVEKPPSSLSFKHVFVVLGSGVFMAGDRGVLIPVSVLAFVVGVWDSGGVCNMLGLDF